MKVTIAHFGGRAVKINARQHTLLSDQSSENFEDDEGIPPQLLQASLGSCAVLHAAQCLRKHKLAREGIRVQIMAEKVKNQAVRIDNFHMEMFPSS
jgi:uncharacterized OsmC-like protein